MTLISFDPDETDDRGDAAGGGSSVDRLYEAVREMAVAFDLKPGERVNEVDLARRLGASRTPLREALNRLAAEGFLTFQPGRGFSCRAFTPREVFELYQLREVLETAAVRLACAQATDAELDEIETFLDQTGPGSDGRPVELLVTLDERFHAAIATLARNAELARVLDNVNARIRFVRWIDMTKRAKTQAEHRAILAALRDRDADRAADLTARHIAKRQDQITQAIREGYARIYVD
ncbi:MAG: GntR family transcriptional regulator [Rhodobacterales bacterium]|nr:GntR family transcriptional regulator [Rhodobacterales bacterium]